MTSKEQLDFQKSIASYQKDMISVDPINKSYGSLGRTFVGWDGDSSIKSDYTRSDYNAFRTTPATIENRGKLLKVCQQAYDKVGIVKNVLDIMADFGSKGIRLRHEIPAIERFYQKWFDKVEGLERSERFLNLLFRLGSVVAYKSYGVLPGKTEEEYKKITAAIEKDGEINKLKYKNRYIPIKYTFLNPGSVEVIGENIGVALGTNIYVLKLHDNFLSVTNNYLLGYQKSLSAGMYEKIFTGLPNDLKQAMIARQPYFPLDPDRVAVFNYKKDDWQSWGLPITYSILDDLHVLEKLKLADISALDGAISNIRLWRIGRLGDTPQSTFLPGKPMLEKLRNILANNVGGGTMDLVWGPELDFKESSTNVHQFLGEQKYIPTINAIYDCLGVPSALRSGGAASSDKEGVVSLKILIERINYGRNLLIKFWKNEIEIVQRACGFSKPPVIEFDYTVFNDEAAEKQLLINLADRDIISHQTIREKLSIESNIEDAKIKREMKKRGTKIPHKASPFHNPEQDHEYRKSLLNAGTVTPSEIGLELLPRKEGEKTKQDMLFEQQKTLQTSKMKQKPDTPGRPKNITETKKRNPKTGSDIQISKSYDMLFWASSAQKTIHDLFVSGLQDIYGKKNLRSLSNEEHENFEKIKCNILFSMTPMQEITPEIIYSKLQNYQISDVLDDVKFIKSEMEQSLGRDLNLEEQRNIYSILYVEKNSGKD